jgi:hypothetical protein
VLARKEHGIFHVLKVWEKTHDVSRIRNVARLAAMEKLTPARSSLLLALGNGPIQLTARQKITFRSWWSKGGWNFIRSLGYNLVELNEIGNAVVRDGKIDLYRAKDATAGLEVVPNVRELSLATLDEKSAPILGSRVRLGAGMKNDHSFGLRTAATRSFMPLKVREAAPLESNRFPHGKRE